MAWKAKAGAAYTGGSGQMAVIGELLHRKCNAAIPHVDVGTDVFGFRDDREEVARIQVKTSPGTRYKSGKGYSAKFGVPMKQLGHADNPPLFYALAVRLENGWGNFIVLSRAQLHELWNAGCGSENSESGDLVLHIQFRPGENDATPDDAELKAKCGVFDFTGYINAWESLPPLKPPVAIDDNEHRDGVGASALDAEEADKEPPPQD